MKYQTVIGSITFLIMIGYGWKLALLFLVLATLPVYWVAHELKIFRKEKAQ